MFDAPRSRGEAALIPFLMAGDPSLEVSERLACALIEEGASVLEIGVPFSDAMADGPVIQKAGERALEKGTSLDDIFEMTKRISTRYPEVPLILFSYLNPLLQYGYAEYTRRARESGVTGTLTVDLPLEEADEFRRFHAEQGLKNVFLASPTTTINRIPEIAEASTGFIYVISRTGVTGASQSLSQTLGEEIRKIRSLTDRPLAVGFGISNGKQAAEVASMADGVVVGSAFVKLVEEHKDPGALEAAFRALARDLMKGIRQKPH